MIALLFKLVIISVVFVNLCEPGMIFSWYGKQINKLPDWLYNPLGGCVKCFAGQVSFWGYLVVYFHPYNLFEHIVFTSSSIFLSLILNKIWTLSDQ
jgi:hypothetical protein